MYAVSCCENSLCQKGIEYYAVVVLCPLHTTVGIVIDIVIGGLKSRGLTKTPKVCTLKISPIEILTIPRLLMLRDVQ
jgi:hypothetical protein